MSLRAAIRLVGSSLLLAALAGCAGPAPEKDALREIHVEGVHLDPRTQNSIVQLRETGNDPRSLSIWIGEFEAQSIARAIAHEPVIRPNPHDLLTNLLAQIDGQVARTLITELRDGTYYAVIELSLRGRDFSIDARPSDAIAVALRARAPIFVNESLLVRDSDIPDDDDALEIDWPATRALSPDAPST